MENFLKNGNFWQLKKKSNGNILEGQLNTFTSSTSHLSCSFITKPTWSPVFTSDGWSTSPQWLSGHPASRPLSLLLVLHLDLVIDLIPINVNPFFILQKSLVCL